jgi:hypothetical protein
MGYDYRNNIPINIPINMGEDYGRRLWAKIMGEDYGRRLWAKIMSYDYEL